MSPGTVGSKMNEGVGLEHRELEEKIEQVHTWNMGE